MRVHLILIVNLRAQNSEQSHHCELVHAHGVLLGLAQNQANHLQKLIKRVEHQQRFGVLELGQILHQGFDLGSEEVPELARFFRCLAQVQLGACLHKEFQFLDQVVHCLHIGVLVRLLGQLVQREAALDHASQHLV